MIIVCHSCLIKLTFDDLVKQDRFYLDRRPEDPYILRYWIAHIKKCKLFSYRLEKYVYSKNKNDFTINVYPI